MFDFYDGLKNPYSQHLTINMKSNLPINQKYWKVKNKDFNISISEAINDDYTANVSLLNSLNTFSEDDIIFVVTNKDNRTVYISQLLQIMSESEIISLAKKLGLQFINMFNERNYQVMSIDDRYTNHNGKIMVPIFDLKTGMYIEPEKLEPITIRLELDL